MEFKELYEQTSEKLKKLETEIAVTTSQLKSYSEELGLDYTSPDFNTNLSELQANLESQIAESEKSIKSILEELNKIENGSELN